MQTASVATVNQLLDSFGDDDLIFAGGITTTFGTEAAEGDDDSFGLQATVLAGDTITLLFDYGDSQGATNGNGNQIEPDIAFSMHAGVVPLSAGLVLFLSGLAGIGFLGRYKARRWEPAIAWPDVVITVC